MTSLASVAIIIVGVVIGLLLGLTGGGGSILTLPLLVYIVGLETKVAIATSLLVVGLASLAALLPHSRTGNVYWRLGLIFGVAGMVGAYCGGRVAEFINDAVLLLLFAMVMTGSGVAMLRKKSTSSSASHASTAPTPGPRRSWARIIGDGFVVGIVTGIVGAGGGFLVVPALVLLGGIPMHAAVGTSLLVITMKCFAGLAGYVSHALPDAQTAVIVSSLAIVGTMAGGRLSRRLSGNQLQRGFGIFVLLVAAILMVSEGSGFVAQGLGLSRFASFTVAGTLVAGIGVAVTVFLRGRRSPDQIPL